MPQTLNIPATPEGIEQAVEQVFTEDEASSILEAIYYKKRNRKIYRRFKALKGELGSSKQAIRQLAKDFNLSEISIKKAIQHVPKQQLRLAAS